MLLFTSAKEGGGGELLFVTAEALRDEVHYLVLDGRTKSDSESGQIAVSSNGTIKY